MNKNHNQPLSLNDIESVKNSHLPSIASVALNELNDVTGGQIVGPEPDPTGGARPPRTPIGIYRQIALAINSPWFF